LANIKDSIQFSLNGVLGCLNKMLQKVLDKSDEDHLSRDLKETLGAMIRTLITNLNQLEDCELYNVGLKENLVHSKLDLFMDLIIRIFNKESIGMLMNLNVLELLTAMARVTCDATYILFVLYARIKNPFYKESQTPFTAQDLLKWLKASRLKLPVQ
jgi:hypothetical protein